MNEISNTTLARRSTRKFSGKPTPEGGMGLAVWAGFHVSSRMGLQTQQFITMRNREKVQMLAMAVEKTLDHQGYDMYQPQVLVIPSNEKESHSGREDDACAMENIFLAVHPLGAGPVWINQLQGVCDEPVIRRILTPFGVPTDYVAYSMTALGYAADTKEDKECTGKVVYVGQFTSARLTCR